MGIREVGGKNVIYNSGVRRVRQLRKLGVVSLMKVLKHCDVIGIENDFKASWNRSKGNFTK